MPSRPPLPHRGLTARIIRAAFAGFVLLLAATMAQAADIRAWDHGPFGRLALDWDAHGGAAPTVQETRSGRTITLSFGAAIADPIATPLARLSAYLSGPELSADRRTLAFTLAPGVEVTSFETPTVVAFDFRRVDPSPEASRPLEPGTAPPASASPDASPTEAAAMEVRVRVAERTGYSRLMFDWPAPTDYQIDRQGGAATIRFDRAGRIAGGGVDTQPLSRIGAVNPVPAADTLLLRIGIPEAGRLRHFRDGTTVIIDVLDAEDGRRVSVAPTGPQADPATPTPPPPTPLPADAPTTEGVPPTSESIADLADGAVFRIDQPVAAAVFRRAGSLYVAFPRTDALDPNALLLDGEAVFGPGRIVASPDGVVLRYPIDNGLEPLVGRQAGNWVVGLAAGDPQTPSLMLRREPDYALGPRLFVPTDAAAEPIRFIDPVIGDPVIAVPIAIAGAGIRPDRRFIQLDVIGSAQGVAITPRADGVTVRSTDAGVEISADPVLRLSADLAPSADPSRSDAAGGPQDSPPLFDLATWQGDPAAYNAERQAHQAAVADALERNRAAARLDFARFQLANGFTREAGALLGLIAQEDTALAARPEVSLLRGAAQTLAGQIDEARASFERGRLPDSEEGMLWRGALAAQARDWPAAASAFSASGDALTRYPPPIRDRLLLWAVEAALRQGNIRGAEDGLNWLSRATEGTSDRWPAVRYFRGEIDAYFGRDDAAAEQWRQAAAETDRYYGTLAEMALLDQAVADGTMTLEAVTNRYEGLRFAWRGDALEFVILERLGDLYWDDLQTETAIATWQSAIERHRDLPDAAALSAQIPDRFATLFLGDTLETLSPLFARDLFDQHREFVPDGPRGDRMFERLADHLIAYELLDQGAAKLAELIENRLPPPERPGPGARLAGLHLLDGQPEAALQALDATQAAAPADLVRERTVLRARALSDLGRHDAAWETLGAMEGMLADRLRVDIAWRAQQWDRAASALESLLGEPPALGETLDEQTARLVVNRGVALALADDQAALDRMAIAYGPAIEGTSQGPVFGILTRDSGGLGPIANLSAVQDQVAEVGLFQEFLSGYREARP